MKKRLFSGGLYREGLRQLRVFGFVSAAVLLLIQIAVPTAQYFSYKYIADHNMLDNINYINSYPTAVGFSEYFSAMILITFICAPIMTLVVFSVFNKRNASDFYHALPYSRGCMYISLTAAVLTWVFALAAVTGGVGIGLHLIMSKVFAVSFAGFFDILLSYIAMILVTVSVITLAMSITGTLFSNITVAALIFGLPRLIISIFTSAVTGRLSYISAEYCAPVLALKFNVTLDFLWKCLDGASPDIVLRGNIPCDIYTLCCAAVFFALALFAFTRRKSELASQPAPGRRAQSVIRCSLAFAISIFATAFLAAGTMDVVTAVIIYASAVIVYFSYELFSTLKWKNLLKVFPGLCAVVLLNLVCIGVVSAFVYGASAFKPSPEEITSVCFVPDSPSQTSDSYGGYSEDGDEFALRNAAKICIDDERINQIVSEALLRRVERNDIEKGYVYSYDRSRVVAISAGGVPRYRNISFTNEEEKNISKYLAENNEYAKAYLTLPQRLSGTASLEPETAGTLDEGQYDAIFDCLQNEIYGCGLYEWGQNLRFETNSLYRFILSYTPENNSSDKLQIPVTCELTPKTYDLILGLLASGSNTQANEDALNVLSGGAKLSDYVDFDLCVNVVSKDIGGEMHQSSAIYSYQDSEFYGIDTTKGTVASGKDDSQYANDGIAEYPSEALKALADGIHAARANSVPSADGYVSVSYSYRRLAENDDRAYSTNYSSGTLYFPLPDGFNPGDWSDFTETE